MDTHKHKCPKCGAIWEHMDSCVGVEWAHTCPVCHVGESWTWYEGDENVTATHGRSCATGRFALGVTW